MIPEAKKRVFTIFMVIYLIFGIFLIYLLFGNLGMDIGLEINEGTGGSRFYVENNSLHVIKNIAVQVEEDGIKKKVDHVSILRPKEREYLDYFPPPTAKIITIVLDANYHLSIKRSFEIPEGGIEFDYKLSFPETVFIGKRFSFTLEFCNKSSDLNNISITEDHLQQNFLERDKIDVINLEENACENLVYSLTPTQVGSTTIYFKVKVQHFNELFEEEISHTVEVRD